MVQLSQPSVATGKTIALTRRTFVGKVMSLLFNMMSRFVVELGKKTLAPWKKIYDQPKQHIKKQRHYFADKGQFSQSYGFSSSYVWMGELDYKESRAPKN